MVRIALYEYLNFSSKNTNVKKPLDIINLQLGLVNQVPYKYQSQRNPLIIISYPNLE
jgi:hypothetical protein